MSYRAGWTLFAVSLFLALGAQEARAAWPQFGGDSLKSFQASQPIQAPLSVLWKHVAAPASPNGPKGTKGGVVTFEGTLFFPNNRVVHAVDVDTGELKWTAPLGDETGLPYVSATPAVGQIAPGQGLLLVPYTDGSLTAFNAQTGEQVWIVKTGQSIRSSPTVVGRSAYFGSDDDFVRKVDLATGKLLWRSEKPLTGDSACSPVLYQGNLYLTSDDMKLWSIAEDSGRIRWSRRIPASVANISPVCAADRIWVAAGTTMYSFLSNGAYRPILMEKMETYVQTTPLVTNSGWYVTDRNGNFYAYNMYGNLQWQKELDGRLQVPALVAGNTIYAATIKGFVYGLRATDGRTDWSYRSEAVKGLEPTYAYYPVNSPLAVDRGKLFVITDDGALTAFAPGAEDLDGPTVTGARPRGGALVNGFPPLTMSVYAWDEGSGINPVTIEMSLDGNLIEQDKQRYDDRISRVREGWVYDPVRRKITYTLPLPDTRVSTQPGAVQEEVRPLAQGRHEVKITALDWKGNPTTFAWGFVVDNTLPRNDLAARRRQQEQRQQAGYGQGDEYGAGGPGMGGPGSDPGYRGQQGGTYGQYRRGAGGYGERYGGSPYGRGGYGSYGGSPGFGAGYGNQGSGNPYGYGRGGSGFGSYRGGPPGSYGRYGY